MVKHQIVEEYLAANAQVHRQLFRLSQIAQKVLGLDFGQRELVWPMEEILVGLRAEPRASGFNVESLLGLIDHVPDGELNAPYTARTVVIGGNTPYVTTVSAGTLPADLTID